MSFNREYFEGKRIVFCTHEEYIEGCQDIIKYVPEAKWRSGHDLCDLNEWASKRNSCSFDLFYIDIESIRSISFGTRTEGSMVHGGDSDGFEAVFYRESDFRRNKHYSII